MQRRLFILVMAALLAFGLAACGSSSKKSDAAAGTGGTEDNTIVIKNFSFTVGKVATAGATITVKNEDSTTHTVTADDGSFNTGNVDAGSSKTFTAPKAGSYGFHCNIHSSMKATLTVT